MPSQVVIRLLLWAVALNAGLMLVMLWWRGLRGRYGYASLLALETAVAAYLLVAGRTQHALAVVVIGVFFFLVVVPMGLGWATNLLVRRGRFDLAERLTGLRELLQPGAGVGRERELLRIVQQIQTQDTDEILSQLMERATREEDAELRGLLQEQVLTLLVLQRRWDDCLQFATEHVTPHLVAARPRLGAALIRVYGEVGDIDSVVRTMYLVEGGTGARAPDNSDVLAHCRVMVLAFCGQWEVLDRLLGEGARTAMEPKLRHFWRGVAHHQAGNGRRAARQYQHALERLSANDVRARETIEGRLDELATGCSPVRPSDPDQATRLLAALRDRLEQSLTRPRLRAGSWRSTPATVGLAVINIVIFGAMELVGSGAGDSGTLIRAGASLTQAVNAGEYWRLGTAMFLHASWLHLAVNVFMLWFLGRFYEQLVGGVRFCVVYFGAGVVGNLASHLLRSGPVSVGASSSIFGILGGALVVLLLSRGRVPEGWRRSMVFVLALVIVLNFLPGLDVKVIDNYAHLGGLFGGAVLSALLFLVRGRAGRWLATMAGLVCVVGLGYCAWGLATSDLDSLAWARSRRGPVQVSHPASWVLAPGGERRRIELFDLLGRDQVVILRVGPAAFATPEVLLRARQRELDAQAGLGGAAATARPLPPGALPHGWAGFRRTLRRGRGRYTEIRAFGLLGPAGSREEWQALLFAKGSGARALGVFSRMLRSLRVSPGR